MAGDGRDPVTQGIAAELPRLWRYGLVLSSNRDTAEELVQATCVPCADGTVYDADTKTCVTRSSGLIDDRDLYVHGRELALAGHYEDALDALNVIADKDAMTLTMIGYSTRKLGRAEEGIAIYHQALAIDPDNLNTHEYLGEGYLAQGRIDLAEAELDVLGRLCGTDCEQYRDLQKAILGEPVWN